MLLDRLTQILGPDHVLTGDATARWRHDWTGSYPSDPIAVLRPADTGQVSAILTLAHETGTPIVPVGGLTGLTGAASGRDMLMLSLDRLNRIEAIDPKGRTATVGAGVILSTLHDAAAEYDLIFPLTFGARGSAQIGGVLSTNAGGSNVLRYGNTRDLVLGLEAVLADGRVMDLKSRLHKDNSGLNLKHLLIGAEGSLGIITSAILKLFPRPRAYATAMAAVPTLDAALTLLHRVQEATGGAVEAFEYMPRAFIERHLRYIDGARAPFAELHDVNILIEVGATAPRDATPGPDGALPIVTLLEDTLAALLDTGELLDATVARTEAQRREMWARREAAAEITFKTKPLVDSDIAVPLDKVATFLAAANAGLLQLDPEATDLSVAHLGDGNVHYTAFPSRDDPALAEAIKDMVEDVVQDLRGSFSAEHGVGLSKLGTMSRRKDPVALDTMRAIKAALDPRGILNPGKTIPQP